MVTYGFTLHLRRLCDHTTWFWRCVGTAFEHFLLGSHYFIITALGSCVQWPSLTMVLWRWSLWFLLVLHYQHMSLRQSSCVSCERKMQIYQPDRFVDFLVVQDNCPWLMLVVLVTVLWGSCWSLLIEVCGTFWFVVIVLWSCSMFRKCISMCIFSLESLCDLLS